MAINRVCRSFRSLARYTWKTLQMGRAAGHQLGEESLTDFNVLKLKIRHSREVITQTFSKRVEARTGADWEWWFTGQTRKWFGFRVQAKILNHVTDTFQHLHYRSPRIGRFQSDRLILSALQNKPPLVPLYCLYTDWVQAPPHLFKCGTFKPDLLQKFGCSVMSAFNVRQLRLNGTVCQLNNVMAHAYPWHCLVCCTGFDGIDLPERAQSFWKNVILADEVTAVSPQGGESGIDDGEMNRMREICSGLSLLNEPPPHVLQLMEEGSCKRPDDFVRGIMIISEQE